MEGGALSPPGGCSENEWYMSQEWTCLSEIEPGASAVVRRVDGGHGFVHRMAAMGIRPGVIVHVVRAGGPVIVKTGQQRLVLGRGMVHRVVVERKELET